jgi:hypothetical protein
MYTIPLTATACLTPCPPLLHSQHRQNKLPAPPQFVYPFLFGPEEEDWPTDWTGPNQPADTLQNQYYQAKRIKVLILGPFDPQLVLYAEHRVPTPPPPQREGRKVEII